MTTIQNDLKESVSVCVEVGRLMLSNGAETYRVEDTIYRIGTSLGINDVSVFVVPTAIIVTASDQFDDEVTQLARVSDRETNLEMISMINQLSRDLSKNPKSANEVRVMLYRMQLDVNEYKPLTSIFFSAMGTGAFVLLFDGPFISVPIAFVLGGIAQAVFEYVSQITNVSFFAELIAASIVGLLASLAVSLGLGVNRDVIILSSVMTLVPGVAITNGLRDLMAGHLLAGVGGLSKAAMTAAAIGLGIALILSVI